MLYPPYHQTPTTNHHYQHLPRTHARRRAWPYANMCFLQSVYSSSGTLPPSAILCPWVISHRIDTALHHIAPTLQRVPVQQQLFPDGYGGYYDAMGGYYDAMGYYYNPQQLQAYAQQYDQGMLGGGGGGYVMAAPGSTYGHQPGYGAPQPRLSPGAGAGTGAVPGYLSSARRPQNHQPALRANQGRSKPKLSHCSQCISPPRRTMGATWVIVAASLLRCTHTRAHHTEAPEAISVGL